MAAEKAGQEEGAGIDVLLGRVWATLPIVYQQVIVQALPAELHMIYQFTCKLWRAWLLPTIPLDMQASDMTCVFAAGGHLLLLKWIDQTHVKRSKQAMSVAARYG